MWAQFWASTDTKDINRWFALPWLYVAVLLDMTALALTGYRQLTSKVGAGSVPPIAMGFLVAAFEMASLQVLQSFASNSLVLLDRIYEGFTYKVAGLEDWSTVVAIVFTGGMIVSAVAGVRRLTGDSSTSVRAFFLVNLACVFALTFLVLSLMLFGKFRPLGAIEFGDIQSHIILAAVLSGSWIVVACKTRPG